MIFKSNFSNQDFLLDYMSLRSYSNTPKVNELLVECLRIILVLSTVKIINHKKEHKQKRDSNLLFIHSEFLVCQQHFLMQRMVTHKMNCISQTPLFYQARLKVRFLKKKIKSTFTIQKKKKFVSTIPSFLQNMINLVAHLQIRLGFFFL